MTQTPFKAGDIVKLKSGGPKMTVVRLEQDQVICIWYNKKNREYSESNVFDQVVLEVVRKEE